MMLGWLRRPSTIARSSSVNCCLSASVVGMPPLGMSCQTLRPCRSQCQYQVSGSIFTCLRTGVEAELFDRDDVGIERLVGRCGVEPVGPVALIEHPDLKDWLVIEENSSRARTLADADLAQTRVAADRVEHHIVAAKVDAQTIELRCIRIGRPEHRVGNGHVHTLLGGAARLRHQLGVVEL